MARFFHTPNWRQLSNWPHLFRYCIKWGLLVSLVICWQLLVVSSRAVPYCQSNSFINLSIFVPQLSLQGLALSFRPFFVYIDDLCNELTGKRCVFWPLTSGNSKTTVVLCAVVLLKLRYIAWSSSNIGDTGIRNAGQDKISAFWANDMLLFSHYRRLIPKWTFCDFYTAR